MSGSISCPNGEFAMAWPTVPTLQSSTAFAVTQVGEKGQCCGGENRMDKDI
jgi:hypothetical protein